MSSKIEVLISCMSHDVKNLVTRTNIKTDALIINQCDIDRNESFSFGKNHNVRIFNTTERGLSKSRNMALRFAESDICLICDDDEILDDDYANKIINAFKDNEDADIIAFQIKDAGKAYPKNTRKINYLTALKLASWQLAFRRKSIIDKGISFDITLGSGVSKAGGEENKFVYDCLRKGLKIIFVPITIGRMIESESQWFHGFTPEYFFDRGIMTKKLMGRTLACLYAVYFILKKYPLYRKDIDVFTAIGKIFKGILMNDKNRCLR